ncbi:MAG: hypothetical protein CMM60_04195 [Rhodospirillaceae bacterium]|nr:hypothetical protein [Rhodospirillaceae bacterium]
MEGNQRTWDVGVALGLWDVNADREMLFLTKRGKIFRDLVLNNPELRQRYEELKDYWATSREERPENKPGARPAEIEFFPGYLGFLQMEQYKPTKIKGNNEFFIIESVSKDEVMLQSMESTKKIYFSPDKLNSIDVDEEIGISVLNVPDSGLFEI